MRTQYEHLNTRGMEHIMLQQIISDLLAAGFEVGVHDGEAVALQPSRDAEDILAATRSTDEDVLIAFKRGEDGRRVRAGGVYCVYGNDGWDVICDYSTSLHNALANTFALSEKLEAIA